MKKLFAPFTFVALLAYACGGGTSTSTQADAEEQFYKKCLDNMEATHSDTYALEVREEYCRCAVATYMETFTANDRALMTYGMSEEQTIQYEEALAPCREQLEGQETVVPEEVTEPTE